MRPLRSGQAASTSRLCTPVGFGLKRQRKLQRALRATMAQERLAQHRQEASLRMIE